MRLTSHVARFLAGCLGLAFALSSLAGTDAYQTIPGVSPQPEQTSVGPQDPAELEAFIDGVMTAQMRAQQAVGGMVVIVKDGAILLAKGYGDADRENGRAVDPYTTLFRPGSVGKLFTWTALMQLVEQGKVSLDADVNTYLTQLSVPDTYPGQPVTVRNLMTHSAGFEDGSVGYLILDSDARLLDPVEALIRYMPQRVRAPAGGDFNNGDMASYSNWGTELAGLIIANVSGLSYNDYIEQNIFQPLGMASSTFRQPVPDRLKEHLASGYNNKGGRLKPQPYEFVMFPAAGSLSATGEDIAKFMIAHAQNGAYQGNRILSDAGARLMHGRALSPNPHLNGAALGFYENHVNGRRLLVHAGNTTQFQTEFNLLIDEGVGLFFSVNSESIFSFSARKELLNAFMDRYYPATLPAVQPPDDFAERAADYAGSYRFNRHSYSTIEKAFSMLSSGISVTPTPHNTLRISGVGGPLAKEWVEVAPDTFRRVDDDPIIAFSRDEQGHVAYLLNIGSLPSMQAYRIPCAENPPLHWLLWAAASLGFVVAVISLLRNWGRDKRQGGLARLARISAGLMGVLQLSFLVLFGLSIVALTNQPLGPYPELLTWGLTLSLIAIGFTVLSAGFVPVAWYQRWWSGYERCQYSLIVVLAVAFLWSLHTWNLMGYKLP